MKKLIIFADYGLDDAAATTAIFNNADKFKSITVVAIGGNVPTDISHRNCITLLNAIGAKDVTVVDTRNKEQPYEYLDDIHGKDGMGDILDVCQNEQNLNIVDFDTWTKTLCGDEIILSLGPMTLVKEVLELHSTHPLILMGGCIKEKPNYKGYEFNHGLDPEAFAYCVKFTHTAITLDTCSLPALDMQLYKIKSDSLYGKILCASKKLGRDRGEENCYVYDDIAACFLLHPERFEKESVKDPFGNTVTNAIYISEKPQFE